MKGRRIITGSLIPVLSNKKMNDSLIIKNLIPAVLILFFLVNIPHLYAKDDFKNNRITSITLEGLNYTGQNLVKKELKHREGDRYDNKEWKEEKNRLESLDIFARVNLETSREEEGINLTYRFSELPPLIPFISMKITDQNGFIAGPALAFLNMFGEAIRLEFYARATMFPDFFQARELLATLASRWAGPIPLEYDIWFIFNDLYNPLKEFKEQSVTAEADFFYRFNRRFKALFTTGIFNVWQDAGSPYFISGDYRAPMFLGKGNTDLVPKAGIGAVYDSRDRRLNPYFGFYGEVRVSQFGGFMGGSGDYIEMLGDLRGYYTFFKRHILHASALGQYRPGTMGAYHFFHTGGANTLRGFEPDSELFGQHEFLGTFEYRYELIRRKHFTLFGFNLYTGLQIIAGTDIAVLWRDTDSFGSPSVLAGYFTGLHFLFPGFDRLRLEFGIRKGDVQEKRIAFAFSIGIWEKTVVQRWRIR